MNVQFRKLNPLKIRTKISKISISNYDVQSRTLPLFYYQTLQLLRVTTSSWRHWIHTTSSRKTTR